METDGAGDQPHHRLGGMGVEVVHDQVHWRLRRSPLQQARYEVRKVLLGACLAELRGPLLFKKRPTERDEMHATPPRLMASSAISCWVQCVIGRPLSCGASQASAMIAHTCSAVKVAWARGIGQPRRDARTGGLRPPPSPCLDGGTADTEFVRRRPDARTATRQQDDPGTHGKLLRAGLLSDKRLQLLALSIGYGDTGSKKQGHRKKGPEQLFKSHMLQRTLEKRY